MAPENGIGFVHPSCGSTFSLGDLWCSHPLDEPSGFPPYSLFFSFSSYGSAFPFSFFPPRHPRFSPAFQDGTVFPPPLLQLPRADSFLCFFRLFAGQPFCELVYSFLRPRDHAGRPALAFYFPPLFFSPSSGFLFSERTPREILLLFLWHFF